MTGIRSGTVEAVITRNNEHIAHFEMFFQVAQPPIDVLQRRHGILQIGAHDRQVGVNQTRGALLNMPMTSSMTEGSDTGHRPGDAAPTEEVADFSHPEHQLAGLTQMIQQGQPRRFHGKIPATFGDGKPPDLPDKRMATTRTTGIVA